MGELSGAQQFQQLSFEDQARYIAINQQMARFARDHAVPIIFAPPRSRGGKINGASGSVLQLGSGTFIVTASHVLEGYETRIQAGEVLNWQVGDLPPFEPIPRIAWRSRDLDIVLLRITADESRWRKALDEIEQAVAAGCDMGAVLNILGRPKTLRGCIVTLVEQRVEGF